MHLRAPACIVGLIACVSLAVVGSGTAAAHTFSYSAPSYTHSTGKTGGYRGGPGKVKVELLYPRAGRVLVTMPDGSMAPLSETRLVFGTAVPTESERYFAATGRSLPSVHGLIILPAATPGGDYTTIWPSN
jgi:hypothetical protein